MDEQKWIKSICGTISHLIEFLGSFVGYWPCWKSHVYKFTLSIVYDNEERYLLLSSVAVSIKKSNQINLRLFDVKKYYDCHKCKCGLQKTTRWTMLLKLT